MLLWCLDRMRQHLIKLFFAAALAALLVAKTGAADYAAGFMIDADTSHNDNIRLVQSDKTAVIKYDLSPKLTLGMNTETDKLELDSDFDFNHYNRSEFNSDDQDIKLALSHQFENSSIGLNANYIHNSTLTSELLTSGRIGTKADRAEQYTVSPNWIYTFNEQNLLQLSGSYTTQNYENNSYTGYKNAAEELDWIHVINERLKLVATASYSNYHSDDLLNTVYAPITLFNVVLGYVPVGTQSYSTRTQTKNFQIGADYKVTETSLLSGRLGRLRNDTTHPFKDPNDFCAYGDAVVAVCSSIPHSVNFGTSAQLDWTWTNERHQFSLNTSKETQPSSNGYTVDALQIGSNWSYQLSELNKILASVSLLRNHAIDKKNSLQNTSVADRDYGSATLQYQRQLSEYWFLSASFQFSEQKYTQIDNQASSRVYSLGISYKPQQWHWAR